MESKDSVRSRLRVTAIEADDRALLEDQIAERTTRTLAPLTDGPRVRSLTLTRSRPRLDAMLDTIVRAAYRVEGASSYVKAKPFTAVAIAAGFGALIARLLRRGR